MNFERRAPLLNFQTMNKHFISVVIIFLLILLNFTLKAQTKTTLNVLKSLLTCQSLKYLHKTDASQKDVHIVLKLGSSYSIFENQIFKSVQAQSKSISSVL